MEARWVERPRCAGGSGVEGDAGGCDYGGNPGHRRIPPALLRVGWLVAAAPFEGEGRARGFGCPPKARGFYRNRALEYLRAVAQRAGMPFLLKEPNLAFVARDDSEEES